MRKNYLMMKYHPAKKEIEFQWYIDGQKGPLRSDSCLIKYMNEKGKFVLQDHGRAFFDDIVKLFDGEPSADIQVTTTKLDYEDLVQMVDFYNADSECKINLTDFIELPDMTITYQEVKKCGLRAETTLTEHCRDLYRQIDIRHDNVRECADSFVSKINEEIQNIKKSIDSLSDNRVSLCFAGVYSAGKSALINAILGYRILPESIKSETAKMFTISSPKPGENIKIKFTISGESAEIEWNESTEYFVFSKGPSESRIRTEIQEVINKVARQPLHEQIYQLLDHLNGRKMGEISSEVTILFPIPLDNEKVQFVIYDTPGTDSNYAEHKDILDEALKVQSQSILIFVVKPDGLEGEGNNILLDRLKEAETNNTGTSIDLGRSLFVINKADTVSTSARSVLQEQTITSKNDSSLSIKLSDKKLFFVSALYSYAARAVANEVATEEDHDNFEDAVSKLERESASKFFFYRQDRCATSEVATERMKEASENALVVAKENEDTSAAVSIGAGLYALEREIVQYGEKYAAAVKAFAIIHSVDRALTKLAQEIKLLKENNKKDVTAIENEIAQLKKTLESAVTQAYNTRRMSPNAIPEDVRKTLKIDAESYSTIVEQILEQLDAMLPKGFLGGIKVSDDDKDQAQQFIYDCLQSFTQKFITARDNLLTQQRDSFIDEVRREIDKNGKISDSAKKYIFEIPKPSIRELRLTTNLDEIFNSHERTHKILFVFPRKTFDKDGFLFEIRKQLLSEASKMCDNYGNDYCNSLNTVTKRVSDDFQARLAEYSLAMGALIQDRDAMIAIGEKMRAAVDDLDKCLKQLNQIIWKEREHG